MPTEGRTILEVPAEHRWLPLVRAVLSAATPPHQTGLDALAELGVVTTEVGTRLLEMDGAEVLRVEIEDRVDGVGVRIRCEGELDGVEPWADGVTRMVLEAMTEDADIDDRGVSFGVGR